MRHTIYVLLLFLVSSFTVQAQPIPPIQAVDPQSQIKPDEVKSLDLPYKPKTDDELMENAPDSFEIFDQTEISQSQKTEMKKYDWSQLPYVPSKMVELDVPEDPVIQLQ